MAKVKIQGHASGTGVVTVTAPNTSTDRTITLPDSTGTLATTADNGSQLDHSGSKKIEAVSAGAAVTGNLTTTGNISTGNNGMVFILDNAGQTSGRIVTDSSAANALEIGADPNNQASGSYTAFRVDNTERMRITPDGLTFNGDTAAANALDDYEEGSFTPVFTGHTGSAGSYNTGEHEARYTKVGRLVTIHWKITLSNKGSWSGEVRMTGLPFTPSYTHHGAGSVELIRVNYAGSSVGNVNAYINSSQTYWRFRYTHDNDAAAMVQVSECADNSAFGGTLSYIVA